MPASFADNAIGFYLQIEDQMTPVFAKANRQYQSMTKTLAALNARVQETAGGIHSQLTRLMGDFKSFPRQVEASFDKAVTVLERKIQTTKPMRIPVEVDLKMSGLQHALGQAVTRSVRSALKGLVLGPVVPKTRAQGFAPTKGGLSANYRKSVQTPPSMRVAKLAAGGRVLGRKGAGDTVPALLSPGEMVIPAQLAQQWAEFIGGVTGKGKMTKAWSPVLTPLAEKAAPMMDLGRALAESQGMIKGNVTPEQVTQYAATLKEYRAQLAEFQGLLVGMEKHRPATGDFFLRMAKSQKEADKQFRALLRDAKGYLKVNRDLEIAMRKQERAQKRASESPMQDPLHFMALSNAINIVGSTITESLWESMNDVNKTLQISRDELAGLRLQIREANKEFQATPSHVGQVIEAMVQLGARQKDLGQGLEGVAATAENAFGIARGAVAQLAIDFSRLGMGKNDLAAFFDNISVAAKEGGISTADLGATVAQQVEAMRGLFLRMKPGEAGAAMTGLAQLQSALSKGVSPGVGQALGQVVEQMGMGTQGGIKGAATLFGVASPEQLMARLQSPAGIEAMMKQFQGWAKGAGAGQQAAALAEALGGVITGPQLIELGLNAGKATAAFEAMHKKTVTSAEGIERLNDAAKNTQGFFYRLTISVSKFVGDAGDKLIAFFKELNPLMLMQWWWIAGELGLVGRGGKTGALRRGAGMAGELGLVGRGGKTGALRRGAGMAGGMLAGGLPAWKGLGRGIGVKGVLAPPGGGVGSALKSAGRGGLELLLGPVRVLAVLVRSLLGPLGILITLVVIFRKELGAFWEGIKEGFGKVAERISEAWNNVVNAWNLAFGKTATSDLTSWRDAGVSFGEVLGQLTVLVLEVAGSFSVLVGAVRQLIVWVLEATGQGGSETAVRYRALNLASDAGEAARQKALAGGATPEAAQRAAAAEYKSAFTTEMMRQKEEKDKVHLGDFLTTWGTIVALIKLGQSSFANPSQTGPQMKDLERRKASYLQELQEAHGPGYTAEILKGISEWSPVEQIDYLQKLTAETKRASPNAPLSAPPPAPVPGKTAMRSPPMNPTALAITGGNTQSEYAVALA